MNEIMRYGGLTELFICLFLMIRRMARSSREDQQLSTNKETRMERTIQICLNKLPLDISITPKMTKRKKFEWRRSKTIEAEQSYCVELPQDILPLILHHISFLGYLSFRGVCRSWRLACLQFPVESLPTNQPPWLMFSNETSSETTRMLLDPLSKKIYSIEIPELCGVRCLAAGHGWLLLLSVRHSSLFFFNPFTKARIDVPFMDCFSVVTFSGPPSSPGCIIFGIGHVHHSSPNVVDIRICRRGDDKWTTKILFTSGFCNFTHAVFCGGFFYCLDCMGKMGIFSVVDDAWSDLDGPQVNDFDTLYLVESGGQIMYCFKKASKSSVGVFCLDGYSWVKVNHIQDRTLYLGRMSVSAHAAKGTKNVVYFDTFRPRCVGVSYDLEDGTLDGCLFCQEDCRCSNFVWIEPRWFPPSMNLHWSV
eukprot:TRINITY_DN12970_c0_g1_i2.p1 TRINITY_DN12970_c0_g1~~TRINITY_DN12970_c0_g1_i2.p1  ORF type:complete len:420 (+),score=45.54 TRINITY_DN12970_c0_g1_i2:369-1628(+)